MEPDPTKSMPTLLNGYRAGTPPLESFLRSQVIHLLKQVAVLKLMSCKENIALTQVSFGLIFFLTVAARFGEIPS